MDISPSFVWFLIGVIFIIAEMALPGFVLVFFAVGAWFVALILQILFVGTSVQVAIFLCASLISLILLRKYCLNIFVGSKKDVVAISDSKLGKLAVVTKAVNAVDGEVKYLGSFWRAVSDENIEKGQSVVIEEVSENGLCFKVKKR